MSDNPNPPAGRNPQEPEPEGGNPAGRAPLWWTKPSEEQPEYLTPDETKPLPEATPGRHAASGPQAGAGQGGTGQGGTGQGGAGQQGGSGQGAPGQWGPPPGGPQYGGPQHGGPAYGAPQQSGPSYGGPQQGGPSYGGAQQGGYQQSGPGQQGGGGQQGGAGQQGGPGQPSPWSTPGPGPYQQGGPSPYQQGAPQPPYQAQGQGGGPPSWQYPPIPIPQPPGPGRRRGRRTSKGLLILLVALAVLVVGSGVTLALRGGDETPAAPVVVDTPTPTPTPSPTPTPTFSPTPTPTVKPKPRPKPKPKPRTPTAFEVAGRNKIYRTGAMKPSQCAEPPFRPTTYAATRAYYNRMLPCLNRAWWMSLGKAGIKYRPPKLVVYAGSIKTPCGIERGTRGYYCSGSETIYMPWQVDAKNYKINAMYTRAWMLNTFAHEYGHHVQQLTGIFAASFARSATMGSNDSKLLESRRRELQASCFGSVYLGANAAYTPMNGPLLASWKFAVANAGDEYSVPKVRDHGAKKNHNFWSLRGFSTKNPGMCNTWTASGKVLG